MHSIAFGTVRQLRSAALLYYALDMQNWYPRQVMHDKSKRGVVTAYVSPLDEAMMCILYVYMR